MQKNSSIDDYEIIKEIGKGSFSNVFLVMKKENNKEYALKKVNLSNMSTKERENALKEVNFLAEIKDSNVIGYEESFYDNNMNILYLVMEYAPYGDLNKIITNYNKLKLHFSEIELLNIYLQIASGLKAIHTKQIIHRDLKSANIFITQKNDLILKIGDFNVSKKIDYLNLKNTQTGTPYYASPEVWENKPYDFKSDIWSLGCLFYEIASLSTPFKGLNMKELFECIEKGVFAPLPKQYSNNITKIIKMCLRHNANLRPNITEIKFFIEKLKLEQHSRKIFDEYHFDNNTINVKNNFQNNNNIKRPISYIKKSSYLNLDNFELPELDNSNRKNKNINLNNNPINNNNYLKSLNLINEKKKRNLTPIKVNYHYLIREKTPIKLNDKLNINSINNEINNNKIINIKDNHSNIYKTDNNIIMDNEKSSPEKEIKEHYNIKLKPPPPYKLLKIINTELEEINKAKEERENNIYGQNKFSQKFNTIKNPLKQNESKISINNSQSIPEIINNSDSQNSQNNNIIYEKSNIIKDTNKYEINGQNNDFNINKNNNNYINEKLLDDNYIKLENNYKSNINIKTNNNKDMLLLLKPNGYFFKKKTMKNLSTLNIHRRPVSSLVTRSTLNNNSDNINKLFDNYNSSIKNNYNVNNKNLSKIKLKPISPSIRSITPFNDNVDKIEIRSNTPFNDNLDKIDSKISPSKFKYNLMNIKYKNNSINDLCYNMDDINNNNNINIFNNDKRYFLKDKRNIRQLNFNKNKINNLSQIKTKFVNFIKPNYKNIEMLNYKTEI